MEEIDRSTLPDVPDVPTVSKTSSSRMSPKRKEKSKKKAQSKKRKDATKKQRRHMLPMTLYLNPEMLSKIEEDAIELSVNRSVIVKLALKEYYREKSEASSLPTS